MTTLSPESALTLFLEKNPNATREEAFTAAWQMCLTRSPEASADETDASYRRAFDLHIENMTVSKENVITWMAISCRGVRQSLYQLGAHAAVAPSHSDDEAVDRFAAAMKEKLAQAREKGRGGWEQCDHYALTDMLREHVEKGDPRDVANFCMFLWNLGHQIEKAAPFDAEEHQILIGYDKSGDAVFGTDPASLAAPKEQP